MNTEFDDVNKMACKTPLEDLKKSALEHYREASSKLCYWSGFVESAINSYNPEETKSNDSFQSDIVLKMFGKHKDRVYNYESDNFISGYNIFDGRNLSELKVEATLSSQKDCENLIELLRVHRCCFPFTPKPQAENKPDWEIVEVYNDAVGRVLFSGFYQNSQDEILKSFKIHSVKRLSINQTFSVGEYAGTKHFSKDRIKEFYIKDGEMYVITDNDSFEFCWLTKLPPQPQKEEQQPLKVTDVGEYEEIYPHGNYYQFKCDGAVIHPSKFPLIKQAIENCLNHPEVPYDWQFRYTQQQVDAMCEDAFAAGRKKDVNSLSHFDQKPYYLHPTFENYKSKKSNQ